jgi:SAM-dependent methyltransferase
MLSGVSFRISTVTQANRTSWNSIAPKRSGVPIDLLRNGGVTLEPFERELAGDVTGQRVLHFACSYGDEVLSWANLGAIATGVDISDVAIDAAARRAEQAGIAADFRQADMFQLPDDLAELDMIYLSWGAICWVPDLARLAEIVASRLRPGGSLLLCDHHPVWEVLSVIEPNRLTTAGNYFSRSRAVTVQENTKLPSGARDEPDAPAFSTFVWPISDVVMALINAGLRLEAFHEAPEPDLYAGLGEAANRLPAYYVIKALKPRRNAQE